MPKVKVWNDNFLPYTEKFKEEEIVIAPNRYILMDKEQAILFKGQYTPIETDGGGQPLPRSFKMIRIEDANNADIASSVKFSCHGCSFVGLDAKDLDNHVNEMHLDQLVDKDEHKKRVKELRK